MLRLKSLRILKGMTREELGELLGVSHRTIGNYEQGINSPSIEKLIQLSKIFNVSIDYMVGNEKETRSLYVDRNIIDYGITKHCNKELKKLQEKE